jgi:thioredoxin 1
MKKIFLSLTVLFFLFNSCSNSPKGYSIKTDSSEKGVSPILPIGEGNEVITTAAYKTFVHKQNIVLVDISASWCGPCRKLAPRLEDLVNNRMPGKFLLVKSDSDRDQQLADSLNITSLPTLLLYKNGELVWRNEGLVDEDLVAGKISDAGK